MNVPIYLSLNIATQEVAANTSKVGLDKHQIVQDWILSHVLVFCCTAILYSLVFLFYSFYDRDKATQVERKVTLFGLGCAIAFVLYVMVAGTVIAFKA